MSQSRQFGTKAVSRIPPNTAAKAVGVVVGSVAAGAYLTRDSQSLETAGLPSLGGQVLAATFPVKSTADFPVVSPQSSLREKDWMAMPITEVEVLEAERGEMKRKMEAFIMGLQGKICKELEELEEDRKFQVSFG